MSPQTIYRSPSSATTKAAVADISQSPKPDLKIFHDNDVVSVELAEGHRRVLEASRRIEHFLSSQRLQTKFTFSSEEITVEDQQQQIEKYIGKWKIQVEFPIKNLSATLSLKIEDNFHVTGWMYLSNNNPKLDTSEVVPQNKDFNILNSVETDFVKLVADLAKIAYRKSFSGKEYKTPYSIIVWN